MKGALLGLKFLALGLLSAAACSALAANAADTTAAISLEGAGPYHRLTLPSALYGRAAYSDLRDVRVRNAQGQPVPFAWLDTAAPNQAVVSQKAPLFALPSKGPAQDDGVLGIRLRADGTLALAKVGAQPAAGASAQWFIDVSQIRGSLLQARFALAAGTQGLFAFELEASDDLRQWRSVGRNEQLLQLDQGGQKLERLSVDLGQIRAKYLRLRWSDAAQSAVLAGVEIDSISSTEAAVQTEWSGAIAPERCAADYCDYRLPRGMPAHGVRINLAQTNTLAEVKISGMWDAPPAPSKPEETRHHHRNPLHALHARHHRSGSAPVAQAPDEVHQLSTVVYRLAQPKGDAQSPALALDAAVYQRLRLRTAGPIAVLGATPPTINVSTSLRSLVFLAQGQAPFSLAWSASADAAELSGPALRLAVLFPNYRSDQPITASGAAVDLRPLAVVSAAPPASAPMAKPGPVTDDKPHKVWLWAALAGGLLLLAGMAFSLFKSFNKDAEGNKSA